MHRVEIAHVLEHLGDPHCAKEGYYPQQFRAWNFFFFFPSEKKFQERKLRVSKILPMLGLCGSHCAIPQHACICVCVIVISTKHLRAALTMGLRNTHIVREPNAMGQGLGKQAAMSSLGSRRWPGPVSRKPLRVADASSEVAEMGGDAPARPPAVRSVHWQR